MAIQQNLVLEQGTDFQAVIKLYSTNTEPLNLTGYSASSQIRKSYDSVSATATLTVSIPIPTNGELILSLNDGSSAAVKYGRYLYDVIINQTSTGTITRAVEGIITVTTRVTR